MARTQIPEFDIARLGVYGPTLVNADMSNGMYFNNVGGNVFIEAISSTVPVSFTVKTGMVIDGIWSVSDDLCMITHAANESNFFGRYDTSVYNVSNSNLTVEVDPAVHGTLLKFRAWRLP